MANTELSCLKLGEVKEVRGHGEEGQEGDGHLKCSAAPVNVLYLVWERNI